MIVALIVLAATLSVIFLLLLYTVMTGISPVPTTPRVARTMLSLVPGGNGGPIYELGSGWGNLAIRLARAFPDRRVHAFELSPLPYLVSRVWAACAGCPNLTIERANFHGRPIGEAGLVCCYLYPGGMERLRSKFEAELRADAVVISNTFAVPGWKADACVRAEDLYASPVYLYATPGAFRAARGTCGAGVAVRG